MTLSEVLGSLGKRISSSVCNLLEKALCGHDLAVDEITVLCGLTGYELKALVQVADTLRQMQCGEVVTYVVNRNINFTNVCIKSCPFCAFSRDFRQEEGYFLPLDEIVRRVGEAVELGATEVCIQAGLPPKMRGELYIEIVEAIRRYYPEVHIHAFSPEEIAYAALRSKVSVKEYLACLKEAGLGSLPGTAAEILEPGLRRRFSPGRITAEQWTEVIRSAHELGIPTTSTIMYGHLEEPRHQAFHLDLIRSLHKETGGFTEFVPLSFVYQEAPAFREGRFPELRAGATGIEVVRMHAVSRVVLGKYLRNIQASWVKEGPKLAQILLDCGANDLGGTLINESISTTAGAPYGQFIPPRELRRIIREAGRRPAQRDTLYRVLEDFGEQDPSGPLDEIEQPEEQFGSYRSLVESGRFSYSRTCGR